MSTSLSQQAYLRIRQKLSNSEFHPNDRISESDLARELGISRTPVREAIRRLQSEGLLYQIPRKGTFLAQPDRNQVIEAYEVREALECMAAEKAAKRMTPKERMELTTLCATMHASMRQMRDSASEVLEGEPLRGYLSADLAFHLLLLRASNNQMAYKIVTDNHMRSRSHGQQSHYRTLHHVAWTWAAHMRIARAIRNRDPRAARYWMKRHIRASLQDALTAFDARFTANNPARNGFDTVESSLDTLVAAIAKPE